MKRVLFSGVALLMFTALYGQKTELKEERLTAQFEKKWSTAIAFTPSEVLEADEGMANNYEDHIATYAPVFLDASLKEQSSGEALPKPFEMHVFILRHREK